MVGLLPLCAVDGVRGGSRDAQHPKLMERIAQFRERHPELLAQWPRPTQGSSVTGPAAAVDAQQDRSCERVLGHMLDENEFLGPHGIRSLSRYHARSPLRVPRRRPGVPRAYLPAESNTGMFGGNSNWRGPVWMPVNVLIIRALLQSLRLLRRRVQGRMPDRFRPADDAVRGGAGDRPPADQHLPARRRRAAAGLRRARRSSRTIRTGATSSCSTSISTATTAPGSAPATRRAGPGLVAPLLDLFARARRQEAAGDRTRARDGEGHQRTSGRRNDGREVKERTCPIHATRRCTRSTPASG